MKKRLRKKLQKKKRRIVFDIETSTLEPGVSYIAFRFEGESVIEVKPKNKQS